MKRINCNTIIEIVNCKTALFVENLFIPAMNDDKTFISGDITAHYLAKVDHRIEIFWNIVIRPVFEMQVSNISFFIFL